ncbi:hypothetical protein QOT17_014635 [Balamuthia mandrillaris]
MFSLKTSNFTFPNLSSRVENPGTQRGGVSRFLEANKDDKTCTHDEPQMVARYNNIKAIAEKLMRGQASSSTGNKLTEAKLLKAEKTIEQQAATIETLLQRNAHLVSVTEQQQKDLANLEFNFQATLALCSSVKEAVSSFENRLAEADQDAETLKLKLHRRTKDIEAYKRRLEESDSINKIQTQNVQQLSQKNSRLTEEISVLKQQLEEAANNLTQLTLEKEHTQSQLQVAKEKKRSVREGLIRAEEQLRAKSEEVLLLEKKHDDLRDQCESRLVELESFKHSTKRIVEEKNDQLQALSAKLEEVNTTGIKFEKKAVKLRQQVQALQDAAEAQKKHSRGLEENLALQLQQKESAQEVLEKRLQEQDEKLRNAEKSKREKDEELRRMRLSFEEQKNHLEQRTMELNSEIDTQSSAISKLKKLAASLRQELENKCRVSENLEAELAMVGQAMKENKDRYSSDLEAAVKLGGVLREEIERKEADIEVLKHTTEELQTALIASNARMEGMEDQYTRLADELNHERVKSAQLQEELKTLSSKHQEVTDALQKWKDDAGQQSQILVQALQEAKQREEELQKILAEKEKEERLVQENMSGMQHKLQEKNKQLVRANQDVSSIKLLMSNELHKQRAAHEHELQTISKEHQDKMKELESRLESMRSRAQQILSGGKRRASKISVVSSQPLEDEEPKDPALGNRSTWDPSSNENSSDDAAEVISQCQRKRKRKLGSKTNAQPGKRVVRKQARYVASANAVSSQAAKKKRKQSNRKSGKKTAATRPSAAASAVDLFDDVFAFTSD